MTFAETMTKVEALLAEAGVTDYALVALNPEDDGSTLYQGGGAASPENVTSMFHGLSLVFIDMFRRQNGLPPLPAAGAMTEIVSMAMEKYARRQEAASFGTTTRGEA